MPFKRYALPQIAARTLNYVEGDEVSYRKGVLESYMPIFHWPQFIPDSRAGIEPVLAHSTLYRWVSSMGAHVMRTPPPGSFNGSFLPADRKFGTDCRRRALIACRYRCLAFLN